MRRMGTIVAMVGVTTALSGCVTGGAFPAANLTTVELAEQNYRVIATDVVGTASAGYVLGFSGGWGPSMQTLAIARVDGEGQLYGTAIADLWDQFEEAHGPAAGRPLGLVNVRYDADALNLVLYTKATVWVRADVVEFGP